MVLALVALATAPAGRRTLAAAALALGLLDAFVLAGAFLAFSRFA